MDIILIKHNNIFNLYSHRKHKALTSLPTPLLTVIVQVEKNITIKDILTKLSLILYILLHIARKDSSVFIKVNVISFSLNINLCCFPLPRNASFFHKKFFKIVSDFLGLFSIISTIRLWQIKS